MPSTPNFGITFPCMDAPVTAADFATLASTTEAALVTVAAEAANVTNGQHAHISMTLANPAVGVETIYTYSASFAANGMTVNTGAGTVTPTTSGICVVSLIQSSAPQSSLTITSQRIAVYNNGVLFAARKWPGNNPVNIGTYGGSFEVPVPVLAGDTLTFRYLWTGTGSLAAAGGASATAWLSMIASP